jgi:threonylcarbamoyladenosine tRNA methylthiotransferase MtaB
MRRPYTCNFFHDLVVKIIDGIPDAAVGVDVLVGFPGETDGAFENTYNLIRVLPVAYLHVFPFSARSGTPASTFDDQIPPDVIKARCERMRNLGDEKRLMFYQGFIGHTLDALIEETRDYKTGFLKGITSNYIPVLVDAPDGLQNTIVPVRIEKITEDSQPLGTIRLQT